MTDRSEILEMMAALQLSGMRAACDEIVSVGIKCQHPGIFILNFCTSCFPLISIIAELSLYNSRTGGLGNFDSLIRTKRIKDDDVITPFQ